MVALETKLVKKLVSHPIVIHGYLFIESRIKMKINQQKWEKGNGEMIGFAISMIALCSIFLIIVSTLQLSAGLNAMRKAINVVGRSAAICTSMEDAETQVRKSR